MKKMLLIILTLFILQPCIINAYELEMEWKKGWGGEGPSYLNKGKATSDDGVVIVGNIASDEKPQGKGYLPGDAIISKYSKSGELEWSHIVNDDSGEEYFRDVVETKDGDLIAVGYIYFWSGNAYKDQAMIYKYDKEGNLLWKKTWGGSSNDTFNEIILLENGEFLVTASTSSTDIEGVNPISTYYDVIIKYNQNGEIIWQKAYGDSSPSNYMNIQYADTEEIILTTSSNPGGDGNPVFIKLNQDGDIVWKKNINGNVKDVIKKIIKTTNNGYIAIIQSNSTNVEYLNNKGSNDVYLVKYDYNGDIEWVKNLGGNGNDSLPNIHETEEGNFIVYWTTDSTDIEGITIEGSFATIISKYDIDGNVIWQTKNDKIIPMVSTIEKDGGIILVMNAEINDEEFETYGYEDIIVAKYNKNGVFKGYKVWGGNSYDELLGLIPINENGFYAYGMTYSDDIEGLDFVPDYMMKNLNFLTKVSSEYNIAVNEKISNGKTVSTKVGNKVIITPTPDKGYKVDKIIVKDTQGNVMKTILQEDETYAFDLYDDVTVEVIFALAIDNPKTGILDIMTILIIGFIMSITGIFVVKNYNERYEI